jgi:hypothetical protein
MWQKDLLMCSAPHAPLDLLSLQLAAAARPGERWQGCLRAPRRHLVAQRTQKSLRNLALCKGVDKAAFVLESVTIPVREGFRVPALTMSSVAVSSTEPKFGTLLLFDDSNRYMEPASKHLNCFASCLYVYLFSTVLSCLLLSHHLRKGLSP